MKRAGLLDALRVSLSRREGPLDDLGMSHALAQKSGALDAATFECVEVAKYASRVPQAHKERPGMPESHEVFGASVSPWSQARVAGYDGRMRRLDGGG